MANRKKRFIYYSSPEHWFQAALELHEAVLELNEIKYKSYYLQTYHFEKKSTIKRPAYSRATYLLMSYALENLLKGIAVLNDPSLVTKGKIEKQIKTHDLNELCSLNQIKLDQKLTDFQSILSTQCVSNARYPVGLNENIELTDPTFTENDFVSYQKLFEKYKLYLVKEFNTHGWDSGLGDKELKTEPGEFKYFES